MDKAARVAKRKADDAERLRLFELDEADRQSGLNPSRLLAWTLKQEGLENMARGRKPKAVSQAKALVDALAFVSVAAQKDDADYQQHVRLSGNYAVAYDGQISAGHPIAEELTLCPHLGRLKSALASCGNTLAISELETGRLSIKGEKLRALVPCLPAETMPPVAPDPLAAPLDDRLKAAFAVCGQVATEAGESVLEASLLLGPGDCTATNRKAVLQFWHGLDLPPAMVVPKLFAAAVCRVDKPIIGGGCEWDNEANKARTLTIWFEGGAWIKTQLYADEWPDLGHILNQPAHPAPLPEGFFEAVAVVHTHNENGFVTLTDGAVQSHPSEEVGAQYDVPGLQGGKSFSGKFLKLFTDFPQADLTTHPDKGYFFGENKRGVLACVIEGDEVEEETSE